MYGMRVFVLPFSLSGLDAARRRRRRRCCRLATRHAPTSGSRLPEVEALTIARFKRSLC